MPRLWRVAKGLVVFAGLALSFIGTSSVKPALAVSMGSFGAPGGTGFTPAHPTPGVFRSDPPQMPPMEPIPPEGWNEGPPEGQGTGPPPPIPPEGPPKGQITVNPPGHGEGLIEIIPPPDPGVGNRPSPGGPTEEKEKPKPRPGDSEFGEWDKDFKKMIDLSWESWFPPAQGSGVWRTGGSSGGSGGGVSGGGCPGGLRGGANNPCGSCPNGNCWSGGPKNNAARPQFASAPASHQGTTSNPVKNAAPAGGTTNPNAGLHHPLSRGGAPTRQIGSLGGTAPHPGGLGALHPGGLGGMHPGGLGGLHSGGLGGFGGFRHSDIRLKQDIVPLGRLGNGLELYRFRYIGENQIFVGVMAQHVRAIVPDAVMRDSDGYLRVNYQRLGLRLQTWDEWLATSK
jgi:hypothetical protein